MLACPVSLPTTACSCRNYRNLSLSEYTSTPATHSGCTPEGVSCAGCKLNSRCREERGHGPTYSRSIITYAPRIFVVSLL